MHMVELLTQMLLGESQLKTIAIDKEYSVWSINPPDHYVSMTGSQFETI